MISRHLLFEIVTWNCSASFTISNEGDFKQEIIATPFIYRLMGLNAFELILKWDLYARAFNGDLILEYKADDIFEIDFDKKRSPNQRQMEAVVFESYRKFAEEFNKKKTETFLINVKMEDVSITRIASSIIQCMR